VRRYDFALLKNIEGVAAEYFSCFDQLKYLEAADIIFASLPLVLL